MSGETIEYTIVNKNTISVKDGDISGIVQKNSQGFLVYPANNFQFEIKLKHKAIVRLVEVKPQINSNIIVELIDEKNKVIETGIYTNKKGNDQADLLEFKQSSLRKAITSKIRIELKCGQYEAVGVGMKYILVKGDKVQEKSKTDAKINADRFFNDPKISHHKAPVSIRARQNEQVFGNRRKTRQDKVNMSEESQIKKATELSLKQAKKDNKKRQETNTNIYVQPRQYTKVDYQKCKNIFKYVNSTWLQAQRKAETQKGIKQNERLSNAIQVRHFHNKLVCVDIAPLSKKQQLEKKCIDMGATIKEEPCDNCLLITAKANTERVSKARKMKNVKILRPEFVSQCKQCNAYLSERDYFHKL